MTDNLGEINKKLQKYSLTPLVFNKLCKLPKCRGSLRAQGNAQFNFHHICSVHSLGVYKELSWQNFPKLLQTPLKLRMGWGGSPRGICSWKPLS